MRVTGTEGSSRYYTPFRASAAVRWDHGFLLGDILRGYAARCMPRHTLVYFTADLWNAVVSMTGTSTGRMIQARGR